MATFEYGSIHVYDPILAPTDVAGPTAEYFAGQLIAIDDTDDSATDGELDSEFDVGGTYVLPFETGVPANPIQNIDVVLIGSITNFGGATALAGYVPVSELAFDFNLELIGSAGILPASTLFPNGLYLVASPLDEASFPSFIPGLPIFDFENDMSTDTPIPECFLSGTGIATPNGSVFVEDLKIGDLVVTADGGTAPVKWVGRQTVSTVFGPGASRLPVCIHTGAFGNGLPKRDLRITADHAMLIDEVLINAGALVNGETISWVSKAKLGQSYTVYHVETDNHDLILAEGTPAETYVDYAARQRFDNYDEYVGLYGEDRNVREMNYPRISAARLVPASVKARLSKSSAA